MAENKLELVVEVDASRATASIKTVNTGLSTIEQNAAKAARGATGSIDNMTLSMAKGAAAGTVLAHAFGKLLGWVKQYAVETATLAARNQTLAVVNQQLAKANGHQGDSIERLVKRIQALGITTQVARDTVNKMIVAQLDLSKATDLARMAQDAAVVGGQNSSEALQGIIHGITTQQVEVLRTYGINVQFEREFTAARQRLGRDLTDLERKNVALNRVLAEAPTIAGAYEASLSTVSKQAASLARYVEEAKAAIGERFLPEMRLLISAMTDGAKWTKDNAAAIALWAKGIAAVALGAAIGRFVTWIAGAKRAVDALTLSLAKNPLTAVSIAATVTGAALYEMYQDSLEFEKRLKEQNKVAADTTRIFYEVGRGKSVANLQEMGYTVEQIRAAFLGAGEAADQFMTSFDSKQFGIHVTVVNEKELAEIHRRQQQELARDIGKRQREIERDTFEAAAAAERAMVSGPGRALLELADEAAKATVFVDSKGVEHKIRLTHATVENMEREHRAKVLVMQRASVNETLALSQEEYKARLQHDTDLYQRRLAYNQEVATRNLEHVRTLYQFEESRVGFDRDARLRSIEPQDAQTIEQKVWVEQQKMAIEVDYLEQVHEIRQRMFDAETSQRVLDYELELKRLGYRADEIGRRIAEYTQMREQIRQANEAATDAAINAARENAANRTAATIRDHNQRIFDSLKQQAGGVFDALLQKSHSVWSAIGNSLKTAILTAMKDVITSHVAAMFTELITGRPVRTRSGNALTIAGGFLGWLNREGVGGTALKSAWGTSEMSLDEIAARHAEKDPVRINLLRNLEKKTRGQAEYERILALNSHGMQDVLSRLVGTVAMIDPRTNFIARMGMLATNPTWEQFQTTLRSFSMEEGGMGGPMWASSPAGKVTRIARDAKVNPEQINFLFNKTAQDMAAVGRKGGLAYARNLKEKARQQLLAAEKAEELALSTAVYRGPAVEIAETTREASKKIDALFPRIAGAEKAARRAGGPPFGTVKEAEQWLKSTLGIKQVNLGADPDFANTVVKGLKEAAGRGGVMPQIVMVDPKAFANAPMDLMYSSRRGAQTLLEINPKHAFWRNPALQMRQMYRGGHAPTADPLHPFLHESGHFAQMKAVGSQRYESLGATGWWSDQAEATARKVSSYAGNSPTEFVAEVYAGKMAGRQFSADVLEMYQRLGGPKSSPQKSPWGAPLDAGSAPAAAATGRWARLGGLTRGAAMMGGGMLASHGLDRRNAGMTVTGGAAMGYAMSAQLGMTGYGGAIAGAGAGLALAGLQRGGWSGVGMSTAGGAIVGMQYGGGLGAAIGAGVGFVAGVIRLFIKGATDKARERIKATYGVDISDKGVLKQITDTAKSAFGGNLDLAIRSPQIRELIELYAMATGQKPTGLPGVARASTLVQSRGSMYEAPGFSNGSPLPSSGGLDLVASGRASMAPPVAVSLNIDGKAVGTAIIKDGRVVAEGAISAMKGNAGRRQMAILQTSPGTLLA